MIITYKDESWYKPVCGNFLLALEEALYVLFELTPTNRCWKAAAAFNKSFYADYHMSQFVRVTIDENNNIFLEDC